MSLYKFDVTVKVDDEDDKYNATTLYCGIKKCCSTLFTFY